MKLDKTIIQDLLNPLTKNHVDRTIGSRVIPNLGVHTFPDRQVQVQFELFDQKHNGFTSWPSRLDVKYMSENCDIVMR